MKVRLALAAATLLALAACTSENATAPQQVKPSSATHDDITCITGYHVATRDDGTEECVPD